MVGLDCFTDLHPRSVKEKNVKWLLKQPNFSFWEANLLSCDLDAILAKSGMFPAGSEGDLVIFHLAAQPGVRSS